MKYWCHSFEIKQFTSQDKLVSTYPIKTYLKESLRRTFQLLYKRKQHNYSFSYFTLKLLQENIFIAFDFIWKVLFSDRNFATLIDLLL